MPYLRLYDYYKQIQAENLAQVISSDDTLRILTEQTAMQEAESYLGKKYNTSVEFTDTVIWSPTAAYNVGTTIELDGSAWSNATAYTLNAVVVKGGNVYYAIQAGTNKDPETETTYWTKAGAQYQLMYVKPPKDTFSYFGVYKKGDQVYWNNKTYTCLIGSTDIDHESALQYRLYENIPPRNVKPDDAQQGVKYWGAGVTYQVAAGTLPTNTSYFTQSDNRNPFLVAMLVDIVLYHLHSRISPRNIPQLRIDRYHSAIDWFKMAGSGKISVNLPLLETTTAVNTNRIRSGGQVKNINTY